MFWSNQKLHFVWVLLSLIAIEKNSVKCIIFWGVSNGVCLLKKKYFNESRNLFSTYYNHSGAGKGHALLLLYSQNVYLKY